jgi:glycosyltransferase involved in cell wall biosynthesis
VGLGSLTSGPRTDRYWRRTARRAAARVRATVHWRSQAACGLWSLRVALEAVASVDGVELLIAGEGDELATSADVAELGLAERCFLVRYRVGVSSSCSRPPTHRSFRRPWRTSHTVVEALAVGTPVIATAAGGVGEIVRDGENGLLVRPAMSALGEAVRNTSR